MVQIRKVGIDRRQLAAARAPAEAVGVIYAESLATIAQPPRVIRGASVHRFASL